MEQAIDSRVVEDHYVVNATQCPNEFRAGGLIQNRAALPFQPTCRAVGIDRHDQPIGLGARALKVANMADMQQVEAAVGESHGPTRVAVCFDLSKEILFGHPIASSSSAADTVAVP